VGCMAFDAFFYLVAFLDLSHGEGPFAPACTGP
jgi:hypothetical protein